MAASAPGLDAARRPARARWRAARALGVDAWLAGLFVIVSTLALADFMQRVASADAGSVWTVLYLLAAIRLTQVQGLAWPLVVLRRYPALCCFLAVALASTAWSEYPAVTLNRSLSMIGTSLMGIYMGHVLAQRTLMTAWLWAFSLLVGVSLALFLVAPDIGGLRIEDHAGRLRGFATGKNILGPFLACAAVLSAAATLQGVVWRPVGIALTAMNVSAAYLAFSATSLVALTAGLVAVVGLWLTRRLQLSLPVVLGLAAAGSVAVAAAAIANVEVIAELLGKKATLSGRTQLWGVTFDALTYQPLIGFGHAAIWGRPETMDFLNAFSDDPRLRWSGTNHAHNGFVNTAIDLGIPVAVLLAAYVVKVLISGIRGFYRDQSAFALFGTGYVVAFIIANVGENHLLRGRSGIWMFFVAVAVALTRSPNGRHGRSRRRYSRSVAAADEGAQGDALRQRLRAALQRREQEAPAAAVETPQSPRRSLQRRRHPAAASQPHRPHRGSWHRRRRRSP